MRDNTKRKVIFTQIMHEALLLFNQKMQNYAKFT